MTTFQVHDKNTAPPASRPLLEKAEQTFGFIPNLLGIFAESPALLEGYLTLSSIFDKSSLTPAERQVVLLAVSFANRCHYCMAAHSGIAKAADVPQPVIEALREGRPLPDARLEALRQFTAAMVAERGWVGRDRLQAFLDAGFTKAQALEVILGVGLKTLSNYTNHLADTPVDEAFAPLAWQPPAD